MITMIKTFWTVLIPNQRLRTYPRQLPFQFLTLVWLFMVRRLHGWQAWKHGAKDKINLCHLNSDRSFYDLSNEGLADIVLPILVRREARNEIQGRTSLHQITEVFADAIMHALYTIHVEDARERYERNHETLLQALAESRAEVIEL